MVSINRLKSSKIEKNAPQDLNYNTEIRYISKSRPAAVDTLPACKPCVTCGKSKKLSEFHKKPGGLYGVDAHCKRCVNLGRKRMRKRHARERKMVTKVTSEISGQLGDHEIESAGFALAEIIKDMKHSGKIK